MKRVCLSLFDGISGLQLSLKRAGIKIDKCYASEIDEGAITITQQRFPDTIQIGDVKNITKKTVPENLFIISAGSPCQDFSAGGAQHGIRTLKDYIEVTSLKQYLDLKKKGYKFMGSSYLLWEFIRLVKQLKPTYFFLENVNMSRRWKHIISVELGVLPVRINSALMTAQNRDRYYWTNIPNITLPNNRGVLLSDIVPGGIAGYGTRGRMNKLTGMYDRYGTTRKDGKANCIVTKSGLTSKVMMTNGSTRQLTIGEAETLQSLPKGYTNVPGVTLSQRWKGIGNGWTIDVVSHLFKSIKKDLVKRTM